MSSKSTRRDFIKASAIAGGGFLLSFRWTDAPASPLTGSAAGEVSFNSYLSISPDNVITILSPNPEVGQNIKTSFPMIVAEELDADWKNVKVVQANLDTQKFNRQATAGSGAMQHSWDRLRKAGATARQMLMEAAAKRWNVSSASLTTENGYVWHKETGRKLNYGALATEAAAMPVPTEVKFKEKKDYKLIGKPIHNVDNAEMITGKPLYGLDIYREGMVLAMIERPPFGTKIKSVDTAAAKAMPGIVDVVVFKDKVAVLGKSTWQVTKARKVLKVEYEPDGTVESTTDHERLMKQLLDKEDVKPSRKDGDVDAVFKTAAKVITREYRAPFLSHACMEPMNFFAHVRNDGVELIGPAQLPEDTRKNVAKLLGVDVEKVALQMTRMGGGFGRRQRSDYSMEAAELSSRVKAPVKVMWTREDDMRGGQYRPAMHYRFQAALDAEGNWIGYRMRGVGINSGNSTRPDHFPAGAVPNFLVDSIDHKSPVTTSPWRAPSENFLGFAEQSFFDEVAEAAHRDPIEFRLAYLDKAKKSPVGAVKYDIDRMKGVIELVAEKSGWGKNKKVFQGFSAYFSHGSYIAQVAEIEIQQGKPVLLKMVAAVDCGVVVNLSGAYQQVKGGIIDGLGHALYGEVTLKDGVPDQKNFDTYRLIRMKEIPDVEVYFVDSAINPTGLGEPALPPAAAALANAFFKATGKRLYNQPFTKEEAMKGGKLGGK
ncbi:xanthine dehydrogenase family protein molybdopterin-binding subunit [Runella slithyformis]|uniref:Isoquinoline 1-oxidoreductase n=1 Tax=Runella slithyformis (strain ATCC 29530 / DSM 19594 / LMG 11500 / NCIMB 11436 / LSU 4) TaxID=761193 RepID=A0A7U4E443_RUNSL|nr:molybdopterin cofactor-binding domain-containing protein [Runella slithyformis]AEI46899.1 Isoquinoline 1-oxidoreductase [Runella slithyformis DSM 19594]